jgi:hypothetical protein
MARIEFSLQAGDGKLADLSGEATSLAAVARVSSLQSGGRSERCMSMV